MLGYLLLFIIVMSALTVFFVKGMVRVMGKYGGESIAKIHRNTECITNEGKVPPDWATPWMKKLSAAEKKNMSEDSKTALKKRAHKDCLRELSKLTKHFERTSIIEDEEIRTMILKGLNSAYTKWIDKSWDEMIG